MAHTAGIVVIADFVFTATAVVAQPVTGLALAHLVGWPVLQGWVALSIALYAFTGLCWLPVVALQLRLRDLARAAVREGTSLPPAYHALYRRWFALGFPAFAAVLAIVWLMVAKPAIAFP